jgi:hypothetical protein
MKIYVAYPYKRASYDIYIRNESNTRWITSLIEYKPNSDSEYRLLSRGSVNGSFENNNNYAHLTLNLNTIGSPETYKVSFYTANKSGAVEDITSRALVPPLPGLNSTWPSPSLPASPIRIKPGQSISVPIHVSSTEGIRWYAQKFEEPIYLDLISHGNVKGLDERINPATGIQIPLRGNVTTNLLLSAPPNIQNVNLSIPARGYFYNPDDPGLHIWITPKFNVEVMQPIKPSVLEDIRNALLQNIGIAIFIPLIITTIVIIVISRFTDLDIFKHLKEGITAGDLLAMDGAVIAGVLILLTIQHASTQVTSGTINKTLLTGVTTASIIIPFSLSAIRTATHGLERRGIQLINTGFIYLIVAVILLGVIATPE